MKRELKPCGTRAAYRRHLYRGEYPCEACKLAVRNIERDRASQRRASKTPRVLTPCGTIGAYQRHKRRVEAPCGPCLDAWAEYVRAWREARKAAAS